MFKAMNWIKLPWGGVQVKTRSGTSESWDPAILRGMVQRNETKRKEPGRGYKSKARAELRSWVKKALKLEQGVNCVKCCCVVE